MVTRTHTRSNGRLAKSASDLDSEPAGTDATPTDRAELVAEVFATLLEVTECVSHRAARPLDPTGLSLAQFELLRILRDAAEGLLVHEVSHRMVARSPNITRLVDKLERKGLVTRNRSEADRRTVRLQIASGGSELLEALESPVNAAVMDTMERFAEVDLIQLRTLLGRLLRDPGGQSQKAAADRP